MPRIRATKFSKGMIFQSGQLAIILSIPIEDALDILNFLLRRDQLNPSDYHKIKNRIKEEGGLEKFLHEFGGLKTSGYYERKFPRNKNLTNDDLIKNKNLD